MHAFHDCHVHLTNYIQEGTDIRAVRSRIMGDTRRPRGAVRHPPAAEVVAPRSRATTRRPTTSQTDAPLYYYSFTDAFIAMAYRSLRRQQRARFDPMITGFNPADMYAADHIRRVLETFPGVFTGIGEFTIHKEFVSSKIAGDVASLTIPALDRILDFAGEVGSASCSSTTTWTCRSPKTGSGAGYLDADEGAARAAPEDDDHLGAPGARPGDSAGQAATRRCRRDPRRPELRHVYFDISWNEVAKYLVATPESARGRGGPDQPVSRPLSLRHRRGRADRARRVHPHLRDYRPLWDARAPHDEKVRKRNFERLFDQARRRVRAWERAHVLPASARAANDNDDARRVRVAHHR